MVPWTFKASRKPPLCHASPCCLVTAVPKTFFESSHRWKSMLLPEMCYMTSKTRSVFTRLFGGSDQKLKRVSSERASHHPAAFQVLGTSCSSQDNFQTNYMFLSHTSGRFHWVSLKPVVCWQEFLWAHPLNSFSFRGMFFFPLWQCELSSSLNSDWAHSFRPVSNISDHRCSLHFEFLLLPTCCSYLFFFFFFLEYASRVKYSQIQSCQLWDSGMNCSGMNGSSL